MKPNSQIVIPVTPTVSHSSPCATPILRQAFLTILLLCHFKHPITINFPNDLSLVFLLVSSVLFLHRTTPMALLRRHTECFFSWSPKEHLSEGHSHKVTQILVENLKIPGQSQLFISLRSASSRKINCWSDTLVVHMLYSNCINYLDSYETSIIPIPQNVQPLPFLTNTGGMEMNKLVIHARKVRSWK